MGLDMYLIGKKHLYSDTEIAASITNMFPELIELQKSGTRAWQPNPVRNVNVEIGYWRKANAIHNWFVNNVQDGVDDCGEYNVSREQLSLLKELCGVAKNDPVKLPTISGFFFGSSHYDEYYFDSLDLTIEIIDTSLKFPDGWEFYYQSSW